MPNIDLEAVADTHRDAGKAMQHDHRRGPMQHFFAKRCKTLHRPQPFTQWATAFIEAFNSASASSQT
jgi:hypothetical protein